MQEYDAIIVGGGCAGIFLLRELSEIHAYRYLLIEHEQLGWFASTRNQSWLHTGALYAIRSAAGYERLVPECRKGYRKIQQIDRDHSLGTMETLRDSCLYLFGDRSEAEAAHARLEKTNIPSRIIGRREVLALEPVLGDSHTVEAALQTADVPFNSYRMLRAVAQDAYATSNADFHYSKEELKGLRFEAIPQGGWKVHDAETRFRAQVVICAVGAMIPDLIATVVGRRLDMKRVRCLVAVFHQQLSTRMLINVDVASRFLNLVPFEAGTTANMGARDVEMESDADANFEPKDITAFARVVEGHLPGLRKMPACSVLFHTCQKLEYRAAHALAGGVRHYFYDQAEENLYYLYPGKFTLAPVAAERLAADIVAKFGEGRRSRNVRRIVDLNCVRLGRRPYLREVTHMTAVRGERFMFDELEG